MYRMILKDTFVSFAMMFIVLLYGCSKPEAIRLNGQIDKFESFLSTDSLFFKPISDKVLEEPSSMLFHNNQLIIKTFCRAKEYFLVLYSINEDSVISESVKYGIGPTEMLSCEISLVGNRVWLYDMSKMRLSNVHIDSLFYPKVDLHAKKIGGGSFYRMSMMNDSVMVGTNSMVYGKKVSFVNVKTDSVVKHLDYDFLDRTYPLDVLIDASRCDVKVNPKTNDILLAYRYTDVIEIYSSGGEFLLSKQGPLGFDVEFQAVQIGDRAFAAKTKNTRKAYVNSYVTDEYIYLLYSGCLKTDENWENGTELFVFSWDGKPYKRYLLEQPIYAFAIDEMRKCIYSYSLQTGEIIRGKL